VLLELILGGGQVREHPLVVVLDAVRDVVGDLMAAYGRGHVSVSMDGAAVQVDVAGERGSDRGWLVAPLGAHHVEERVLRGK
jgi:hypothetical protein